MPKVIEKIAENVQRNCHIADARHGADYGLCSYLMKMREFYRWEMDFSYTQHLDKDALGEWLMEREIYWQSLEDEDYAPIHISGKEYDPFDTDEINQALSDASINLAYSAGMLNASRPDFYLGELKQRDDLPGGYTLWTTGRELARCLSAPPGMAQDKRIFLRQESLRRYLWERYETWRWHRPDNAYKRALDAYPFEENVDAALDAMTENESQMVREHEIGECIAGEQLGSDWNHMLVALAHTPAELMARAVRDNYADCMRTLPALLNESKDASMHAFVGNMSPMRKKIFPAIIEAYDSWWELGDPAPLSVVAEEGAKHWLKTAELMLQLYRGNQAHPVEQVTELIEGNIY